MTENKHDVIDLTAEDIVAWYVADREHVQDMAEANFGRRLSDQEIKRILCAFLEEAKPRGLLIEALLAAIEDAMENSDGQWNCYDAHQEGKPCPTCDRK